MNDADEQYINLLARVLNEGVDRPDRTGTGTRAVFGHQMRFDLAEGFPILTTKRVHFLAVVGELLWMLSGSTNVRELRERYGVTIWDEWEREDGTIGPGYGAQWRHWGGIDQIRRVLFGLKEFPESRRHLVSAWNVEKLGSMALPPCHFAFQLVVMDEKLNCHMMMRSTDVFLGLPFNIASYALLTHMVAQVTNLGVGELLISMTDVHLYQNHLEQARLQMVRDPLPLPRLVLNPAVDDLFAFTLKDVELDSYVSHPRIDAAVSR